MGVAGCTKPHFPASGPGTALEHFRLRHGGPPEDLEALVPEILTVLPLDPFTGGPLGYRFHLGLR
jgi:hypothetical protein